MEKRITLDEAKAILKKHGQEHILYGVDKLNAGERVVLLRQISGIDWSLVEKVRQHSEQNIPIQELTPPDTVTVDDINNNKNTYKDRGMFLIRTGKVGAVMLAGGMGTRLGVDRPKGMVNIGINKQVYIFECLIKNLLNVTREARATVPLYIMTNVDNREATELFLKKHSYFGYPADQVFFFNQKSNVCVDTYGKLFFDRKGHLASSPNGNGGWFTSMMDAGLLPDLRKRGIEWLNVFSVDNVLQKILDPVFIGATVMGAYDSGAKAVKKQNAHENVGVFCKRNGKPSVVEYYELSEEAKTKRAENGELYFSYGVILNYLFRVDLLSKFGDSSFTFHIAKKKIPFLNNLGDTVTPKEPNGYKFETLAADMVGMMEKCLCFEVIRNLEFAPVKNATGEDSIESARILLKNSGVLL